MSSDRLVIDISLPVGHWDELFAQVIFRSGRAGIYDDEAQETLRTWHNIQWYPVEITQCVSDGPELRTSP